MVAASRIGIARGRPLAGEFTPPGDKSITHRALLFGLLASGETRVRHANPGEDCARSAAAAAALGAGVERSADGWIVRGTGGRLVAPRGPIDCGNSGTTLRLATGIVAGHPFVTHLAGDESLSRRPMRRIAEPLGRMGAVVEGRGRDCTPPLAVRGAALQAIDYTLPMASAQVATCVLLAGLTAPGTTRVTLPGPARDHTEHLLAAFGVTLGREEHAGGGRTVSVPGGATLQGAEVNVPGDFSAAAFLFAAAAVEPGASVTAQHVNLNPTRTGFLDVLRAMGAGVRITNTTTSAGESAGDVSVTGPAALKSFAVPADWLPRMVDEAPAWAVVAAAAPGTSRLSRAAELRVKESDRIASIAAGLAAAGITAETSADGIAVTGGSPRAGAVIATEHDHRIAMAFAVLGSRLAEPLWLDDVTNVATSWPAFFETLASLGARITTDQPGSAVRGGPARGKA